MKSPEMGMGMPGQEAPEHNKEDVKREMIENLRKSLENINVGQYTADKHLRDSSVEEIYDEPKNLEKILEEIGNKIDLSVAEHWTREKFLEELSKIKLHFDFNNYRSYDDFFTFHKEEEPMDEYLMENMADMLYGEEETISDK